MDAVTVPPPSNEKTGVAQMICVVRLVLSWEKIKYAYLIM